MDNITSDIDQFRKYASQLQSSGKQISGKFFNEKKMHHFPHLYEKWKTVENKNEFIYKLLHEIENVPLCPICQTPVKFRDFKTGYNNTCGVTCKNRFNAQNPEFKRKISEGLKAKYNEEYFKNKYEFVKEKDGENFLITGYCKHGDFYINKNKFTRLMNNKHEICEKCAEENAIVKSHINVYEEKYANENYFKLAYPNEWKTISLNCQEPDASFSEKRYMFKHGIQKRPVCTICKKRSCKFISSFNGYTQTCTCIDCIKSSSTPEKEIFNLVKSQYDDTISRYKIDNEEIDIYVPSLKTGIEFNGLYWHSEKFKNKNYHLNKNKKLRNLGIKMFTIWEDDWRKKRYIIESQINNLLGNSKKIYARNTVIKEVPSEESVKFLNQNHIQGSCISSIRLGLFLKDELVAIMTFSKRSIFEKKNENEYELIRFCNKCDYSVVGGASKLFKFFCFFYKPAIVVSYANYDISNGNLYEKLGFKREEKIYPGFWWSKNGEKFNRCNFMKHKIAKTEDEKKMTGNQLMLEQGYFKIWNSGNLKYIWVKNSTF